MIDLEETLVLFAKTEYQKELKSYLDQMKALSGSQPDAFGSSPSSADSGDIEDES